MKLTLTCLLAATFAAPSVAQSITRDYRLDFADSDSVTTTGSAFVSASAFGQPLPSVLVEPGVEVVGVGFWMTGTQRIESDYANLSTAPLLLGTGAVTPNHFGIIGSQASCGIGVDPCSFCTSGGGSVSVPANSTTTLIELDRPNVQASGFASAAQGSFAWPCILAFDVLNASVSAEIISPDASELRAEVTIEGYTEVTAELSLNANVTASCPGTANSSGSQTLLEYFGSLTAGNGRAAVRATGLPGAVFTVCVATDAAGATPIGSGAFGSLCLRGTRVFQELKVSEATGEAIFDLDLSGLAPGDTLAVQLAHRDIVGGFNTSNMLTGTAQ